MRLVALDDLLVGRLRLCTVCGRAPMTREGIWLAEIPGGVLAIAYILCAKCVDAHVQIPKTLDAKLRARYNVPEDKEYGHAQ